MRSPPWNSLLTDLRAAARLGHPAALEAALEAIASHPEIASNGALSTRLQTDFLRPAARTLAGSGIPAALLTDLRDAPLAGLRALGAAALALRHLEGHAPPKALRPSGRDPRPDVRRALGQTLAEAGAAAPEKILSLGRTWLRRGSPRLRHTALLALRGAVPARGAEIIPLLQELPAQLEAESGEALAALLISLAQNGQAEAVLDFVAERAAAEPPDLWLAGRVLSGKWAAARAGRISALLETLEARHGESRHLSNIRRALRRHGG